MISTNIKAGYSVVPYIIQSYIVTQHNLVGTIQFVGNLLLGDKETSLARMICLSLLRHKLYLPMFLHGNAISFPMVGNCFKSFD